MTQHSHRNFFAAAALALGLAGPVTPAATTAQNLPGGLAAITVEPDTVDFGVMERHQTRTKNLIIRNEGGADLNILEIESSCGCTAAQPETRLLKPGQTTGLKITFDSRQFQGEQVKHVTIRSNDPATPRLEIPVRAMVHVPILIKPEKLAFNFGRVRRGVKAVRRSWLQVQDMPRLKLTPGPLPENLVQVSKEENVEGDPKRAILTLSLQENAPHGPFQEILRVRTNVPDMDTIDYEVSGEIIHDIEVFPTALQLRYVDPSKPLSREVRVRPAEQGVKFKVIRAECDMPEFTTRIEERIPGQETVIVLSGKPVSPTDPRAVQSKGRLQGTLRIFTDHPDQPQLQVKVTYLLRI